MIKRVNKLFLIEFVMLISIAFTGVGCGKNSEDEVGTIGSTSEEDQTSSGSLAAIGEDATSPQDDGNIDTADRNQYSSYGENTNGEIMPAADSDVDLDLTILSSTMVYSEVYNMLACPDDYMGKTIRMTGVSNVYTDESTNKTYYSCIITDATACCTSGLEYELPEGEYPENGVEITVTGTFDVYDENGMHYAILRESTLEN